MINTGTFLCTRICSYALSISKYTINKFIDIKYTKSTGDCITIIYTLHYISITQNDEGTITTHLRINLTDRLLVYVPFMSPLWCKTGVGV